MSAGQLNQRLELQQVKKESDERGNRTEKWEKVIGLWGKISHEKGDHENEESGQRDYSTVEVKIRINRRSGVKTGMRFVRGENSYKVLYEIQNYQNAFSDFMCEQVLSL